MFKKIKEAILHKVVARAAAAGVAAGVAWLSRPEVVSALSSAGVTVKPEKFGAWALMAVTTVLALAYHFIEHKFFSDKNEGCAPTI